MTANIWPPLSEREKRGAELARRAAGEGMVLLQNDQALPLKLSEPVALFGVGAARTVRGGTGSGDPFNGGLSGGGDPDVDLSPRYHIQIASAMEEAGVEIVDRDYLMELGRRYDQERMQYRSTGLGTFCFPEEELSEDLLAAYSRQTNTAVFVLSRNSGEGTDRTMTSELKMGGNAYQVGDYRLSDTEKVNLEKLRVYFEKMILVLNVGAPVCVSDLLETSVDAILLMGLAGQECGAALTDVLFGSVNPSGKLTATWALRYEDYPCADSFLKGDPEKCLYPEGVFVGYRYFATCRMPVGYPFGFGLSYTTFSIGQFHTAIDGACLHISAVVQNTGSFAGREVLQVYVSATDSIQPMPEKELAAYQKTKLLAPGESEEICFSVRLREFASFCEKYHGRILARGEYFVSAGTSSEDIVPVCMIINENLQIVERLGRELCPKEEVLLKSVPRLERSIPSQLPSYRMPELLTLDSVSPYKDEKTVSMVSDKNYTPQVPYEEVQLVKPTGGTYMDYINGKLTAEEVVSSFSREELCDFCCGTGWGVEDESRPVVGENSESVPGAAGETTHIMEKIGIPSIILADGPAGVRISQHFEATVSETQEKRVVYHYCIAWPSGTVLAQSFDPELQEEVGGGLGKDMEAFNISILLGPGMNIQRNPLCGRNFEYFSEDPLLTGKTAAAIVRGIQNVPGRGACIKHFAANSQETLRDTVDAVLDERTLREIYLKGFEICVKEAAPVSVMTSYNLLNGTPTADSYDLCTNVLRGEWGFSGIVITDWNGGSSTPRKSMHAGNDLIMPGGKMRAMNILQAFSVIEPQFDERGQVKMIREVPHLPSLIAAWNSFRPKQDGDALVCAEMAGCHEKEIRNGILYVDQEPLYTRGLIAPGMKEDADFFPFAEPATTHIAQFSEDGTSVIYRGSYAKEKTLCIGDVQKCAVRILKTIALLKKQTGG